MWNDDGYWRAVEVWVYGSKPPHRPHPVSLPEPTEWFVTKFTGTTLSIVLGAGFTALMGSITFEKPNGRKYTGAIGLFGGSVGLSLMPNLSKIPGFSRFPALTNFLQPGLSSAFMKWLMTSPSGVAKILWSSPRLMHAVNILKGVVQGSSGSSGSWWSAAIGMTYGSGGRNLDAIDFSGSCICYADTGGVAVGGFGVYVIFFGLDPKWNPLTDPVPLVDPWKLEEKAKGVAFIAAASVSAQIPGLGVGATVFWGEIT